MSSDRLDRRDFVETVARGAACMGLATLGGTDLLARLSAGATVAAVGNVSQQRAMYWHVK